MPAILMSYRPEDSARDAIFLQGLLEKALGKRQVLLGIGPVEPGEDRLDVIDAKLETCDTLLCLVGSKWLTSMQEGRRRLDNPEDPIRLEIAAALGRVKVILVLVGGARRLAVEELPSDVAALTHCDVYPVRDENYTDDVEILIGALKPRAAPSMAPQPPVKSVEPPAALPLATSTFDVFISYNSQDISYVTDICRELEHRGVHPWCAEHQLRAGDDWLSEVDRQIRSINAVAVIIGTNGLGDFQPQEISKYLDKRKLTRCPVIPVLLPDTDPVTDLPFYLTGLSWADFRSKEKGYPFERLVLAIKPELNERAHS
jgi:TIR domain